MKSKNAIAASAIAGLFALSMAAVATDSHAAKKQKMEKCYGVVKAGKNDCKTANGSCAGSSKIDGAGESFVVLPKGTCDKIVGGSLTPKA